MWEMASLCSYEELCIENDDVEQLAQKLMCTTLELEKLKSEAMDEMRRNKEYIKQLIHLVKSAIQERDEAIDQLQKLFTQTTAAAAAIPLCHSDSPPAKANSSVTESNSLSETYNLHPRASTPVGASTVDRGSLIIDAIAKGRILPQRGNLLQTVMRAGPLLQTLLVAGPLPRWRNPPQLHPFQIPAFSINGCQGDPTPYAQNQLSCASASSMMNANGYAPFSKRQRFT